METACIWCSKELNEDDHIVEVVAGDILGHFCPECWENIVLVVDLSRTTEVGEA